MTGSRDSLRAEFPSLGRAIAALRLPAVAQEPAPWALLSALGAALLFSGVLRLVLFATPSSLQDPSLRLPLGATWSAIITLLSHVVAGAVLVRSGGRRALWLYAGLAAVSVAASLLAIMTACDRATGKLGRDGSCNVPLFYIAAGRAPEWIGIAIGALVSRAIPPAGPGANLMLRGGGAYSLVSFAVGTVLGMLSYSGVLTDQIAQTSLFVAVSAVAGAIAGIVLARARFGAALLVLLAIVGPGMGFALPLLRAGGPSGEPVAFTLTRWSIVLAPGAATAALPIAWVISRKRGAFF